MLNARLSFTGITNISNKADLIDRMVCLKLKRIDAKKRKTLDEVMDAFKKDVPYLLYEIMKILAKSIQVYKELDLHSLPRMADFAKWGYAIAEVMGYGGETFLEAYEKNQNGLLESMVEEDSLANVLIQFMKQYGYYKGSMTELLSILTQQADNMGINIKFGWIREASVLSRRLFELESVLNLFNIYIQRGKSNGNRYVELELIENTDEQEM